MGRKKKKSQPTTQAKPAGATKKADAPSKSDSAEKTSSSSFLFVVVFVAVMSCVYSLVFQQQAGKHVGAEKPTTLRVIRTDEVAGRRAEVEETTAGTDVFKDLEDEVPADPKQQVLPPSTQPPVDPGEFEPCTATTEHDGSETLGQNKLDLVIQSDAEYDVNYYWVNFHGEELLQSVIGKNERRNIGTFPGHLFRFRSIADRRLILEYQVPKTTEATLTLVVNGCGDPTPEIQLWPPGREKEFEELVSKTPYECDGDSKYWSCIHHVSKEEEEDREIDEYGFARGESGRRAIGETIDDGYVRHIDAIIPVTKGPGLLLMNQTQKMKDIISEWYEKHTAAGDLEVHEPVAGGYTNSHIVQIEKLNLDKFPVIHNAIVNEMRQVLQWWTNQQLKHTSTFGLRLYKRGSMLINHIDRMDTHLASAVIQVSQHNIDEGGGWPLEVLVPPYCIDTKTPPCHRAEVYMQPGEMVLYEGARIMHGRPMRLRGEAFGNVFSHFAPVSWNGPSEDPYRMGGERKRRKRRKKTEL